MCVHGNLRQTDVRTPVCVCFGARLCASRERAGGGGRVEEIAHEKFTAVRIHYNRRTI